MLGFNAISDLSIGDVAMMDVQMAELRGGKGWHRREETLMGPYINWLKPPPKKTPKRWAMNKTQHPEAYWWRQ